MNDFKSTGYKFLTWVQCAGLMIIALATLIAMGSEISSMIKAMNVSLSDLLLLFIYLEVFAMVAMYLESGKLPIRMPLYIAIVALARYMILDMKNLDTWRMLGLAGTALVLAITILIIRFSHAQYSNNKTDDH